jgi:hypothetical protein
VKHSDAEMELLEFQSRFSRLGAFTNDEKPGQTSKESSQVRNADLGSFSGLYILIKTTMPVDSDHMAAE